MSKVHCGNPLVLEAINKAGSVQVDSTIRVAPHFFQFDLLQGWAGGVRFTLEENLGNTGCLNSSKVGTVVVVSLSLGVSHRIFQPVSQNGRCWRFHSNGSEELRPVLGGLNLLDSALEIISDFVGWAAKEDIVGHSHLVQSLAWAREQEPHMEHQQAVRHLSCFPTLLQALHISSSTLLEVEGDQPIEFLSNPNDVSVKVFAEVRHGQLLPVELLGDRQERQELSQRSQLVLGAGRL
mmetsp:Transcript_24960/g.34951  ORF Transcript_24960/g.34951 Transcript_24960/m.34951 type:complete len:237 (-) Transcript_24960:1262-1972(-)